MRPRHPVRPLPRQWLMTDERMGDRLWLALEAMPRGSGVVFRHYATTDRRNLLAKVMAVARRRRLVVLAAGDLRGADGVHNGRGPGLASRSAHNRREVMAAVRAGADLVFISPIWPTRSHPGARTLGIARLGAMICGISLPVIALGGMDARRMRVLRSLGIHGWAGIDAWSEPAPSA